MAIVKLAVIICVNSQNPLYMDLAGPRILSGVAAKVAQKSRPPCGQGFLSKVNLLRVSRS